MTALQDQAEAAMADAVLLAHDTALAMIALGEPLDIEELQPGPIKDRVQAFRSIPLSTCPHLQPDGPQVVFGSLARAMSRKWYCKRCIGYLIRDAGEATPADECDTCGRVVGLRGRFHSFLVTVGAFVLQGDCCCTCRSCDDQ